MTTSGLDPPRYDELIESLPKSIAMSYYYRIDAIGIAEDPPFDPSRLLGDDWQPFDVIAAFHNVTDWESYLPLWFQRPSGESPDRLQIRSLLDTRRMGGSKMMQLGMSLSDTVVSLPYGDGDQLIVDEGSSHRRIYHLHRGRLDEPRILTRPAEAIDAYVEHTLLSRPEPFDFLPYSQTFKQAGII